MSVSPQTAFRWGVGHGVALSSLTVFEVEMFTYTKPLGIYPRTTAIDPFPVRRRSTGGKTFGDGFINIQWELDVLPLAAFYHIIDTYLTVSSSEVASAPVTIYTIKRFPNTYARYNAYLQYPIPNQDYRAENNRALDVRLRFEDLTAI